MRLEVLHPGLWWLLPLAAVAGLIALRTLADASRGRAIAMAALRAAVVALTVVGLAQPRWMRQSAESRLCLIAAVDVSESVPASVAPDAAREVAALAKDCNDDHWFGLVLFAGRAEVALPPGPKPHDEAEIAKLIGDALAAGKGSPRWSELGRDETRVDAALELAASTFPAGLGKRVVVFGDGHETDGDAVRSAASLARLGVDVHARVLVAKDPPLDVLIAEVAVPTQVRTNEAYDVTVALIASQKASGHVRLYRNGFLVANRDLELAGGPTKVVFRQSVPEGGQYLYRAKFETAAEQPTGDDEGFAYVTARGKPRALVLGTHELASTRLLEALRSQGISADYRDASGAPETVLDLLGFDAVALNDVPASQLSEDRMRLLRDYVRDFGGGLVAIGGSHSFGPGGWTGTPLEDVLPVSSAPERRPALPSCVIMVVDTSRSIATQRSGDGSAFDGPGFVRAACKTVARQLGPNDVFGVVGTGNEKVDGRWHVRLQQVYDQARIEADIERELQPPAFAMNSNLYRSMRRVADELSQRDTMRKIVILCTDGYFDTGALADYRGLAAMLASNGIQISTLAAGPRADRPALEQIARWGGGCLFDVADPKALATGLEGLFTAARAGDLIDEPFRARQLSDSPLLAGVDATLAPMLYGYVRTSLNLGASNVLCVPPQLDPLLATWDCGAGKAAAFTADARERWSVLWIREWAHSYDLFWSGVVRGVMRDAAQQANAGRQSGLLPQVTASGQNLRIEADYLDPKGGYVDGSTVNAELYYLGEQGYLFSRSAVERLPLAPLAPGRYGASHRVARKGLYALKVSGPEHGHVAATGVVVSNFKEYLTLGSDPAWLAELARAGGGASVGDAAAAWSLAGKMRDQVVDLGAVALAVALLLFLADVAVRRWPAIVRALPRSRA